MVVIHRPEALQHLFNKAALEQELAFIGYDHRCGLLDAVSTGDDADEAPPGNLCLRVLVNIGPDNGFVLLPVDNVDLKVCVCRASDDRGRQTAHSPVDLPNETAHCGGPVPACKIMDIKANRRGEFFDQIRPPSPAAMFKAEDGLFKPEHDVFSRKGFT